MTPEQLQSLKRGDTVWVDFRGTSNPFEATVVALDGPGWWAVQRKFDGEEWGAEAKQLHANREACLDARETKLRENCTKAEFALSRARERLAKFKKWRIA